MTELTTGRCFCRAITYAFSGTPNWSVHCHCESCRRATSSPMTTFISVPQSALRFTKGKARYFQSSPGVKRGFCGDCGSQLTYETEKRPGEVDLYALTLDDPTNLRPSGHVYTAEQIPWFEVLDQLPRYAATSQGGTVGPVRIGPKRS